MNTECWFGLLCVAIVIMYPLGWCLCIIAARADALRDEIERNEKLMPTEYWDAAGEYPEDYEEENDAVTER